jgi:hypothetical protein
MAPATVSHVADAEVAEALSQTLLAVARAAHGALTAAPMVGFRVQGLETLNPGRCRLTL